MSHVVRTITTNERLELPPELEGVPAEGLEAWLRMANGWEREGHGVTYELHLDGPEGCTVHQFTGRASAPAEVRDGE